MGYWLRQLLHTEDKVQVDQTYRYKLPTTGFWSAFSVRVQDIRSNDRDDTPLVPMLHERITKVEMTSEGVKVLKSMRAREMMALNLFDFGRPCEMQDGEGNDEYNMFTIYLLAGRSLQDKKWMWDMSKFTDPEIAITNNVDNVDGVDFDEDVLQYKFFGWRWMGDPIPTPIGYMRADERLYYDTGGTGTVKELTITRGHKIRRLLVMGWEAAHTLAGHFTRLEVEVDEGAYHPVTVDFPLEWCWQNKRDYDLDIEVVRYPFLYGADAHILVDACMCYPLSVQATIFGTDPSEPLGIWGFGNGSLDVWPGCACHATLLIHGVGYLTSLVIGFDKEPELEDMLDTAGMSKLSLEITETIKDKTVSVVVEEEILY